MLPTPNTSSSPRPSHSPYALLATPETIFDSSWYPDAGASNHITSDVNHFSNRIDYLGNDQVYLANGSGISIYYVGSARMQHSNLSHSLY